MFALQGYNTAKAYIATQGPKSNTVCDFWRMIWQENVQHIIMVANIYEEKKVPLLLTLLPLCCNTIMFTEKGWKVLARH